MSPDGGMRSLADEANRLAKAMPASVVESLARALGSADLTAGVLDKAKVLADIAHPHYRALSVGFLDSWRANAPGILAQAAAAALLTAAAAEREHGEDQTVELVWTGPDIGVVPFRRTEQAVLQVLDSARRRVLVVSYAVYNIPRIRDAIIQAASRGVAITVVVEAPDPKLGRDAYDTLRALGPAVAARSSVYLWPHDQRPKDPAGKSGILHIKCIAGDGQSLFISSANLTEQAFTLNLELGLLISGGRLPAQIESHFDQLIAAGVLARP